MNNIKLVKWSIYLFIAMSCIVFIYTLGFATDFYEIGGSDWDDVYQEAQKLNRLIFNVSIITFVEIWLLIILDNHTKIAYKIYNTILGLFISMQTIVISIYTMTQFPGLKKGLSKVNVDFMKIFFENFEIRTGIFTWGYVIYSAYIVIALLLLGVTIMCTINKYTLKKE